jgi:hypothetical protein
VLFWTSTHSILFSVRKLSHTFNMGIGLFSKKDLDLWYVGEGDLPPRGFLATFQLSQLKGCC